MEHACSFIYALFVSSCPRRASFFCHQDRSSPDYFLVSSALLHELRRKAHRQFLWQLQTRQLKVLVRILAGEVTAKGRQEVVLLNMYEDFCTNHSYNGEHRIFKLTTCANLCQIVPSPLFSGAC